MPHEDIFRARHISTDAITDRRVLFCIPGKITAAAHRYACSDIDNFKDKGPRRWQGGTTGTDDPIKCRNFNNDWDQKTCGSIEMVGRGQWFMAAMADFSLKANDAVISKLVRDSGVDVLHNPVSLSRLDTYVQLRTKTCRPTHA